MSIPSDIDETLRHLGSVQSPSGMEERIHRALQHAPRRFSMTVVYAVSGGALAASVAVSAMILHPGLFHPGTQNYGAGAPARIASPAPRGFGSASAVHVPAEPIPVQPTPTNHGSGRARSSRANLPPGALAPLPRGVAHGQPLAATGATDR
jgi:hypothetical protein